VTVRLSDRWRVSIAGGAGLSDGSADYFGGLPESAPRGGRAVRALCLALLRAV